MSIGLTKEELEERSKGSLIKYIGQIQEELKMIYSAQLTRSDVEAANALDSTGTHELKCPHESQA